MGNAYCTLEDVRSSLSGDVSNVNTSHDQSLVNKIVEVSRDIDRKVGDKRGESDELFSFLAESQYGQQVVYMSATPPASSGGFVLSHGGSTTDEIPFDSTGATVQTFLEVAVGAGNVSVSGFAGGPWTVDFAGTLTGPQPTITGAAYVEPTSARIVVLPTVQGVEVTYGERLFRAAPAVYGKLLVIDDCVEVSSVLKTGGGTLTSGVDFLPFPLRGNPTYALKSLTTAGWEDWPTTYAVRARWGYATSVPADVRETCVIEVIRGHFSALAGNDDRLGMTPFGSVITSKAFTSRFKELVCDYGDAKLWW